MNGVYKIDCVRDFKAMVNEMKWPAAKMDIIDNDGNKCALTIEEVVNESGTDMEVIVRLIPIIDSLPPGSYCPDCGSPIEHEGGCKACRYCGWSKCS